TSIEPESCIWSTMLVSVPVTPVGLVITPTFWPRRSAQSSAASTSAPGSTRCWGRPGGPAGAAVAALALVTSGVAAAPAAPARKLRRLILLSPRTSRARPGGPALDRVARGAGVIRHKEALP